MSSINPAAIKRATNLIAESMTLLSSGQHSRAPGKMTATEKIKGTNRGLVKLGLQRKAALEILIQEWNELSDEERAKTHTIRKTQKSGKVTTEEVPVHPKPTYGDVILLFKKGVRELPEVSDEAVDEAWKAAQAKPNSNLRVASEAFEVESSARSNDPDDTEKFLTILKSGIDTFLERYRNTRKGGKRKSRKL